MTDKLLPTDTKNMRWLLATAAPEVGCPAQFLDALVDITNVCKYIEDLIPRATPAADDRTQISKERVAATEIEYDLCPECGHKTLHASGMYCIECNPQED